MDSTDVANSPSVAMVAAMDPHVMVVASRRLVDTVDVALPILVDMVALPLSVATTLVLVVRGSHGLRVAAR
ncbi:hypothetical protein B6U99_04020 [Candidatus Geothermarchaeota archaeon ex4572_27]|nr:MAG: hypothetical protein B6U99_04020 [Candidatus Geothermarchaeota archaeon ex4572_27]